MAEESGSFWKSLPGVLTALAGFITAATAAYVTIGRHDGGGSGASAKTDTAATVPAAAVAQQGGGTAKPSACMVAGQVYNQDDSKPLPGTRILVPNGKGLRVLATTGLDGKFSASCADFPASAFPLHLKVGNPQWRCSPTSAFTEGVQEMIPAEGDQNLNISVSVSAINKRRTATCRA
jgi:hypothetical protein